MSDESVDISFITEDPESGEFVLYLVEDGPWPKAGAALKACMVRIEGRILAAVDAVLLGVLSEHYPDSKGRPVRIQVDSPHGAPKELDQLIERVRTFMRSNEEFLQSVRNCAFVADISLVTGKELGRFVTVPKTRS